MAARLPIMPSTSIYSRFRSNQRFEGLIGQFGGVAIGSAGLALKYRHSAALEYIVARNPPTDHRQSFRYPFQTHRRLTPQPRRHPYPPFIPFWRTAQRFLPPLNPIPAPVSYT